MTSVARGLGGRPPGLVLIVSTVARVVLGVVLLVAGAIKVADPVTSEQAVRAYDLLPDGLVTPVGWGLPFLEVALGLLLLVGFGTRIAAAVGGVLMIVFIAAVSSAWARGLSIDCGCFGGGGQVEPGQTQYVQEILRDTGLLALAAWLVRFPRSRFALDTDPHTHPPLTGQES